MTDGTATASPNAGIPLYTGFFGYPTRTGGSSSYIYWIDGLDIRQPTAFAPSKSADRNGPTSQSRTRQHYRFRPDGTAFEIYAQRPTNPRPRLRTAGQISYSATPTPSPSTCPPGGLLRRHRQTARRLGFARASPTRPRARRLRRHHYYAADNGRGIRGNLFNGNPARKRSSRPPRMARNQRN